MNLFFKRIAVVVALCGCLGASAYADSLEAELRKHSEDSRPICCLPVWDKDGQGYCYYSANGFVAARIDDAARRNAANSNREKYPVCQDKWCSFLRTKDNFDTRYFRMGRDGRVLKEGKFEKDNVGLLKAIPAREVNLTNFDMTAELITAPACEVKEDFNLGLLGSVCVMRANANGSVSFIGGEELGAAVEAWSNGDYDSYPVFYEGFKGAALTSPIIGVMDKKYIPRILNSKEDVPVSNCADDHGSSANRNRLKALGFRVE